MSAPILVGIERNERAAELVRAARSLALELGAPLELVHVDESAGEAPTDARERYARDTSAAASDERADWAQRLAQVLPPGELDACLHLTSGKAAAALLRRAEELDARMLFLGAHTRRGLAHLGNTARELCAHGSRPVWVQSGPAAPVRRVLAAVDFSDLSLRALDRAQDLARALGATLCVAHVHAVPAFAWGPNEAGEPGPGPNYVVEGERQAVRERLEQLVRERAEAGVELEPRLLEGAPSEALAQEQADLWVVGTHGRGAVGSLLLGSVAQNLLRRCSPVLVVPPAAAS